MSSLGECAPESLVRWARIRLEAASIRTARWEAEVLFTEIFRKSRSELLAGKTFEPSVSELRKFRRVVGKRAQRYPLQYIIGKAGFMSMDFRLRQGVFIPRPETEILVEKVIERIKAKKWIEPKILEIGTGSGNIAISLTKYIAGCRILASEISRRAYETALVNARKNGVKKKIDFVKSDYFSSVKRYYIKYFDVIISNPPYVKRDELKTLEPELAYEDRSSFDGGKDGLVFYRRILKDGRHFLKDSGFFAFEIGQDQAAAVKRIAGRISRRHICRLYRDYHGLDRVLLIEKGIGKRNG